MQMKTLYDYYIYIAVDVKISYGSSSVGFTEMTRMTSNRYNAKCVVTARTRIRYIILYHWWYNIVYCLYRLQNANLCRKTRECIINIYIYIHNPFADGIFLHIYAAIIRINFRFSKRLLCIIRFVRIIIIFVWYKNANNNNTFYRGITIKSMHTLIYVFLIYLPVPFIQHPNKNNNYHFRNFKLKL